MKKRSVCPLPTFPSHTLPLRPLRMKRYLYALGALTLVACARPVAPEGGPKDTTPPAVVKGKSTPNFTTRFQGIEIRLGFDEWIVLQDAAAQVLVSPPLAKRPDITLKGKTVVVRFKEGEVLRPNTTYTINFGTAVKDLHEKNPAKDLRFVFSTGDFIDSLSVAGTVVDAFSGDPLDNISVMLYDNPDDSIIRKERPYYLARTDKSGEFMIPNVRAGAFKCVAIEDGNQNMKWEESERIGFPETPVTMNDSTRKIPPVRVFRPVPPLRLAAQITNQYGQIKLGFTTRPDSIALQPDLPGLKWQQEREGDTVLVFWYDRPDSVAWKLIAGKDTVSVKALSRGDFLAGHLLHFADDLVPVASSADRKRARQTEALPAAVEPGPRITRLINVHPDKPLLLTFNNPVSAFDTTRWLLDADTVPTRSFAVIPDSAGPRALRLQAGWQNGKSYSLTLLPGAVTDMYGARNADTLLRTLVVLDEKKLGALNLTVENLAPGQTYVLRLLNGNTLEEERLFAAAEQQQRFVFTKLQPASFTVVLIMDRNGNGRWDPGDYFAHRQPEPVFSRKLEALRANWEVEASLDANLSRAKKVKE